eukprot:CAMPEP_0116841430 /NCGR_PEP_ID=MMETSP0418-20121206/10919_1 /TAXON_ID=1158023 /ORGANISM="Astrosyne radiata, Strain 13vi08-1A" /LENGTH=365 /DNA_ID=CAMNT_0004471853 /DNA_START=33 /DNA_END=1130 /DNA_ORIENTATION=-
MSSPWIIDTLSLESNGKSNDDEKSVKVDFLTVTLLMASTLYAFCWILAARKLWALHRLRPQLSTKKLLIVSISVVCAVRIMTILGVAAMNMANVRAHYSLQPISRQSSPQDKDQKFYDNAMTVLFDLPNCIVVSTYVFLTLVWAECFIESRFHTEPMLEWKRRWWLGYTCFNSMLYAAQLILYTCIFLASGTVLRTIVYAAITGINFSAVSLVLLLYINLQIRFSGFPFRSEDSQLSLQKISNVMTLWSLTRIGWGVATLLVFCYKIELLQDSHTPFWSFVVLFLLLFVCEIIPMIATLDYSYMNMVGGLVRMDGTSTPRPRDMEWFPDQAVEDVVVMRQHREALLQSDAALQEQDDEDGTTTAV